MAKTVKEESGRVVGCQCPVCELTDQIWKLMCTEPDHSARIEALIRICAAHVKAAKDFGMLSSIDGAPIKTIEDAAHIFSVGILAEAEEMLEWDAREADTEPCPTNSN